MDDWQEHVFRMLAHSPSGYAAFSASRYGGLNHDMTALAVIRALAGENKQYLDYATRAAEQQRPTGLNITNSQ